MAKEFRLQDPGEGIHEAEIREIAVSEGDHVEEGDTVFVVETDKAAVDLPAPYAGTVASIDVAVDDLVEVGALLMTIDTGSEEPAAETEEPAAGMGAEAEAEAGAEAEAEEDAEEKGDARETEDVGEREDAGEEKREPAETEAKEHAEAGGDAEGEEDAEAEEEEGEPVETRDREEAEAEEAPRGEAGTGKAGTGKARTGKARTGKAGPGRPSGGARGGGAPVKATPATRRVARELDVDLAAVDGTGPDGRVTEADVRGAAKGRGRAPAGERAPEAPVAGAPAAGAPAQPRAERVPLRSVRRAVARTMARAWAEIPHVTHHDTVDVTDLERLRRRRRDAAREEDGPPLTLTPFLIKAAAAVLADHPRFNASLDAEAEEIVLHPGIHVGVATATDRGLLVPVIRDAAGKDILTLAAELAELTAGAKDGSLGRDRLTGGTFSITNVGPLGGSFFTPIINPPQAAILGVGRAALTPVAEGDIEDWGLVARLMLPLSLGFDHRLNDGADAARFVSDLAAVLADPERLLLRA